MLQTSNIIKITESPRESFQTVKKNVSTEKKVEYINILLKAGYDCIDIGSFVSPKAVPALSDTGMVLEIMNKSEKTKVLITVGNLRGAETAANFNNVDYIGFLYSVSPRFLELNINSNQEKALETIDKINEICAKHNKKQLVNLCLAFGNPYGDDFNPNMVLEAAEQLRDKGIKNIVLADTLACGDAKTIKEVFELCINKQPEIEFGFHLHTDNQTWYEKVKAAYNAGCRNFDSVIMGLGGCPMSGKEMINNLNTEDLLKYCSDNQIQHQLNPRIIHEASNLVKNNWL
jgi:hydroxymethylglutaryl-CoA lyase